MELKLQFFEILYLKFRISNVHYRDGMMYHRERESNVHKLLHGRGDTWRAYVAGIHVGYRWEKLTIPSLMPHGSRVQFYYTNNKNHVFIWPAS